jgi:5'-nucleotidase
MEMERPMILVSNDDGYRAPGLLALIEAVRPYGDVLVVAPQDGQSGQSHAITVKVPVRVDKYRQEPGLEFYVCNGTPVDCVKLAQNRLLDRKPSLLVSGINHGANSSASVLYSGTVAVAAEGCMYDIPGIAFSLLNHDPHADFMPYVPVVRTIVQSVLEQGLKKGTCLNVNIPNVPLRDIRGIRVCRHARGYWVEEYDRRVDPNNKEYFWLTGEYFNEEPEAEDTDEWALSNDFVSVSPVQVDLTCYGELDRLRSWNLSLNISR